MRAASFSLVLTTILVHHADCYELCTTLHAGLQMDRSDKVTYRDLKYSKPTAPRHQEGHAAVKLTVDNGRFIAVVGG
jgi:hypothetical protein